MRAMKGTLLIKVLLEYIWHGHEDAEMFSMFTVVFHYFSTILLHTTEF